MWRHTAKSSCNVVARQRHGTRLKKSTGTVESFSPPEIRNCRRVAMQTSNSNSVVRHSISNDNISAQNVRLIDFHETAKIVGEESHVAMIELQPGETLRAESGAMLFMTDGVVMDTKMNGASSAFNRMLTGQNIFLTDFHYEKPIGTGTLCLGTDFPSKILRFTLSDHPENTILCQKGAYLASNPDVDIQMQFTKSFTAGFFGGQGFVLQKLSGTGGVLVKGGGTVVKRELLHGETLRVTSGSIIAFESTIQYDVQMMPGIKNAMFGGEGLFVTTLSGPGNVWLQGLPPDRMIAEIARRVPSGGGIGLGIPIPIGGGGGHGGDVGPGAETTSAGDIVGATSTDSLGAATEAAVQADRNATIASSGVSSDDISNDTFIDADSPSALFGDAAPVNSNEPKDNLTVNPTEQSLTDDTSFSSSYGDKIESSNFEESLSAEDMDMSGDHFAGDGELFDDSTGSVSSVGEAAEAGKSVLGQIWSFFYDDQ